MRGWILLDVNGTLTDPAGLGAPWGRPDIGERVLEHAVQTATVAALLNSGPRAFAEHLRAALQVVGAQAGLDLQRIDAAMAAARTLPARPDAEEALARLRARGHRLLALTNSGAQAGRHTLEANGLAEHIERFLGVDAVQTFKPDPAVYAYALRELTAAPADVTLIATHPWDLAGAAHAGIRTAWVRHRTLRWPDVYPAPDVQGETLTDLACALDGPPGAG